MFFRVVVLLPHVPLARDNVRGDLVHRRGRLRGTHEAAVEDNGAEA